MPYGFVHDVPVSAEVFRQMKGAVGDAPPDGLIVNVVYRTDSGIRHVAVWETRSDWDRFHENQARAALQSLSESTGFVRPSEIEPPHDIEVLDVWLGATQSDS